MQQRMLKSTISWFQGLQFVVDICGIVNACYQSLIGRGKCKAAYEITLFFYIFMFIRVISQCLKMDHAISLI
jgi:hypothetical protein